MTALGAVVAVLAMRLLWPESSQVELDRLLARGALADAAYVRAMLNFWEIPAGGRPAADRTLLAPARRACGLAINDAEETLDRIPLEPRVPLSRGERWEEALTFVTYLRRITRAVTTLAFVGSPDPEARSRAESVEKRLEKMGHWLHAVLDESAAPGAGVWLQKVTLNDVPTTADRVEIAEEDMPAEQQLRRMERQADVLERAAATLATQP